MKRLTTDTPDGNFETMLNFVFSKDGWAYIRYDGKNENVSLTKWVKAQCSMNGCHVLSGETPQEIDEEICDCMVDFPCAVALAYCFASQAVHLRGRLKMYEDILFFEDGTERLNLDDLRGLIALRAQHDKLDRSRWVGCDSCMNKACKSCEFSSCPPGERPCSGCVFTENKKNYTPTAFCPNCGRPLTEEAWADWRKRWKD